MINSIYLRVTFMYQNTLSFDYEVDEFLLGLLVTLEESVSPETIESITSNDWESDLHLLDELGKEEWNNLEFNDVK